QGDDRGTKGMSHGQLVEHIRVVPGEDGDAAVPGYDLLKHLVRDLPGCQQMISSPGLEATFLYCRLDDAVEHIVGVLADLRVVCTNLANYKAPAEGHWFTSQHWRSSSPSIRDSTCAGYSCLGYRQRHCRARNQFGGPEKPPTALTAPGWLGGRK